MVLERTISVSKPSLDALLGEAVVSPQRRIGVSKSHMRADLTGKGVPKLRRH